jgi:hypothetical protein
LDAPKEIGIASFTQQMLCKKHNEELGANVDAVSKHTRDTLAQAYELLNARKKIQSRHWTIQYFETDMLLLERWCLKTLINMNHQGGLKYLDDSEADSPPSELVEFVFGRRQFTDYKGLYMVSEAGSEIHFDDGWLRVLAKASQGRLVGGQFMLWGIPFYFNLLPTQVKWGDAVLMRRGMKHWFATRDDKGRQVKSHCVTFTYSS